MKLHCQCSTLSCSLRIATGVSIAIVGLVHYLQMTTFAGMVAKDLGTLTALGTAWAYILPALQIVGGLWFAFDKKNVVPALLLGVAFGSIAIGMVAKSVLSGTDLAGMGASQNALLWLLFVYAATMMDSKKCDSM